MSVWLTIPSAKPAADAEACLSKWRERGYKLAIFRDAGAEPVKADLLVTGEYCGWARTTNGLCRYVLALYPEVDWVIVGGDDVFPDPDHAPEEIAAECKEHFGGTLGICQPIGDGFEANPWCCPSPWLGRAWCMKAYCGQGPFWPEYRHFWTDTELRDVATRLGLLWDRPDLNQFHDHWTRRKGGKRPDYMMEAARLNPIDHELYQKRKAEGFPGSELK